MPPLNHTVFFRLSHAFQVAAWLKAILGALALAGAICFAPGARGADDIVVADFEGPTYGLWKVTGAAFGSGPAQGKLPGQMAVDGFKGKGLANSFFQGDDSTGALHSPEFTIERKFISFLMGGGKHPGKACMNLRVDGKVVRSATGPNGVAGGSEALAQESWNVSEFIGKMATLEILDTVRGGWGHITVDHIVLTDKKPPGLLANAQRYFRVNQRYLNIPIQNGAPRRVVSLLVDGKLVVRNDIELAPGKPDWWAPMEVTAWNGKTVTLVVDKMPEDSTGLATIEPADAIRDEVGPYREKLRGQFHFSPRRGWNNDPNGMVFFNGEYHLFFQHNPYGWDWGNMHWGHAVSKDLVHWEELGDKLLPDAMGPMFSGSAVVDWKNTSGFGTGGKPPLVLLYTAAGNPTVQCVAYSNDGRSFTKYAGNPVIREITGGNRDPKVFWHEPTRKWVMTLYVELNKVHTIHFFTSPNLKDWKLVSTTDGFFECPDFFELAIDNNPAKRKWVLTGASSEYQVGSFDGRTFIPETPKLPGHRGKGFYAAQTFSDIPQTDGRRIQIGWFQTPTLGMPFNQSMTLPLEQQLITTLEGPRLTWTPVRELAGLRAKTIDVSAMVLQPGDANPLAALKDELVEIRASFTPGQDGEVVFTVRGATIVYDVKKSELVVNGHRAPAPLRQGRQNLVIYCDRMGLEVFASDGLTYVPMPYIPSPMDQTASLKVQGGPVGFKVLQAYGLRSAWEGK